MEADVTYRDYSGEPVKRWCTRVGTREEIMKSAHELLAELREEWPRATVWVGSKRVQLIRRKTDVSKRCDQDTRPTENDDLL